MQVRTTLLRLIVPRLCLTYASAPHGLSFGLSYRESWACKKREIGVKGTPYAGQTWLRLVAAYLRLCYQLLAGIMHL